MTQPITLSPFTSVGAISPILPGKVATGDATTFANLKAGGEFILNGYKKPFTAVASPTSTGPSTCTLEILNGWPSDITFAPRAGYACPDATSEDELALVLTADAAGNTAGRSAFDSQAEAYRYFDAQAGIVYERNGPSGTWTDAGTTIVYRVATTGSDASDDGPFLTVQKAVDLIAAADDLTGWNAIISLKAGTYAPAILRDVPGVPALLKICGEASLTGTHNLTAVTLSGTASAAVISATNLKDAWTIEGLSLTSTKGHLLQAKGARLRFNQVQFNAAAGAHIAALAAGSIVLSGNGYTIAGSAAAHLLANGSGATVDLSAEAVSKPTITITGSALSRIMRTAFAWARASGHIFTGTGLTFTGKGNVAGPRWRAEQNSSIDSGQSGENYLPGSTKGIAVKNGEYI